MRFYLLLIWLNFLFALAATAQGWEAMPADTHKVRALQAYLEERSEWTSDTAQSLLAKGYQLARSLDDWRGMGSFSNLQAFSVMDLGNYEDALPYFERAGQAFLQMGDSLRWARVQINHGLLYFHLGRSDSALAYYQRAASTLDRFGQPNASLFNNMAIIYRKQEKYEPAIALYERSLALKEAQGDTAGMAATYQNLGLLYGWLEDTTQALELETQALNLYQQLGKEADVASVQVSIGHTLMNLNQNDAAYPYLEAAYQYYLGYPEESYYRLRAAFGLGELSRRQGAYAAASDYLKESLRLSQEKNWQEEEEQSLRYLGQTYVGWGRPIEAYAFLEEAYQLRDTLRQQSRLALEEEMQARFEVQQAEQEKLLQAVKFEQQQRLSYLLLVLGGMVLAGALFFLWQKNRHNRSLARKHVLVEQALAQKEALMKEMNHRIKNHLQFLSSLLRLQSYHIPDEQAREVLDLSRGRVLSMALIHRHLYQDSGTIIQLDAYLRRIAEELIDAFADPAWDLDVETRLSPLQLDVEQAVPLGLILNELVTNALKYAFSPGRTNQLRLHLRPQGNTLVLEVADNGQSPRAPEASRPGDGFGQEFLRLMAERLDAKIEKAHQAGTLVRLSFPFSPAA